MPRVTAPKPAAVQLVRNGAKPGPKAGPPRAVATGVEPQKHEFEKEVCPLCVEDLDDTDMSFQPCPCGYRVCLFCFEKLKLLCSSACPNCRRGYGSDEAMEYAKQVEAERLQEAQRPKAATAPASAASTAAPPVPARAPPKPSATQAAGRGNAPLHPSAKRGSGVLDDGGGCSSSTALPSGVTWASASPVSSLSRNQSVEIERPALSMDESSWPSLGGPSGPTAQPHQHEPRTRQHATQQHQQQQHNGGGTAASSQGSGSAAQQASSSQQRQQQQQHQQQQLQQDQQQQHHRHSPSAASEGINSFDMSGGNTRRSSSVASSMDREASSSSLELMSQDPPVTPEQLLQLQHQHQQYQAQQAATAPPPAATLPPLPPPGFDGPPSYFGAQVSTTVNGLRRAVNVPLSLGGTSVEPYPEAPALLASMQQGVAQGTLSSKEAAAQLFALLRQKDQEGQAARTRSVLAAAKPPPGFGVPAVPSQQQVQQVPVPQPVPVLAVPGPAAAAAPQAPVRPPPPPPGFSHLQGTVVPGPPSARTPIQPPMQAGNEGGFVPAAGQIGLNANGTPRTYSMWSGLPGMDLSASTGLSSLWQNLNATTLSMNGGVVTQPYNPLGLMDPSLSYGARQPMPGAPKPPPPGFGPAAYANGQSQQPQQLSSGDPVFRPQPYQPYNRYNPMSQGAPAVQPGAYRPQLGAGL